MYPYNTCMYVRLERNFCVGALCLNPIHKHKLLNICTYIHNNNIHVHYIQYNRYVSYVARSLPKGIYFPFSIFHFFLLFFSFSNHPHANGSLPLQPSPICLPEPDPVKSAQADDEDEKEGPYHCNDKPDRKYSQRPTRYQKFGCPRRG